MMSAISEIESTGRIDENIAILRTVVSKMAERMKSLLSLQQIESKKYICDMDVFTSNDILDKIRDEMFSSARVYSHSVKFDGFSDNGPRVLCDISRLSTAIMNLFNNSCKYTQPPGTILFKYEISKKEHKFSIIDNGVGIDEKDQENIFIKFYQVQNNNIRSFGGFGLGLSIVKEIANLHNGDITITSPVPSDNVISTDDNERPGTRITINIPI
jgi:two-component system phosphate regulon sensor histidine kinase PhoR